MSRTRIVVGVVIVAALAALGYAGYVRYLGPEPEPAPTVPADSGEPETGPSVVSAEGVIQPSREAGLAFRLSARVSEVLVSEGQAVMAGDLLVRLESADLEAAVTQAQASLELAEAQRDQVLAPARSEEIAILQAQLDASPTDAQRDVAEAQLALALVGSTDEQIAIAGAGVRQAEAALEAARVALDELTLTAPFDGVVVEVAVEVGELAAPGLPAVRLADFSSWRAVTSDLSETDVVLVAPGQPARVTLDAYPGLAFSAAVSEIALLSQTNRGNVTYAVTLDLAPTDALLRWGMTAFVDIQVGSP